MSGRALSKAKDFLERITAAWSVLRGRSWYGKRWSVYTASQHEDFAMKADFAHAISNTNDFTAQKQIKRLNEAKRMIGQISVIVDSAESDLIKISRRSQSVTGNKGKA